MFFKVSFGFCAMVLVLAWLDWKICVWFLLGVVVHELGHLAALKLCKTNVRKIWFTLNGASIGTDRLDYRKEIVCAAAGPLFSFLLGFAVLRFVPELALISLMLGMVNCLPIHPLDGGRILKSILLLRCSPQTAEKAMRIVSFVISGILMLLACWGTILLQSGLWPMFAVLVLLCRLEEREK